MAYRKTGDYRWLGWLSLVTAILFFLAYLVAGKERDLLRTASLYEKMQGECTVTEVRTLLREMKCFPVKEKKRMEYEDGYGGDRSYGGERKHEGIDIMPDQQREYFYQVLSASDGVVEKLGWLELGGYRIGIRSKSGFYYYYAHLSAYEEGLKEGSVVRAGDRIGYMGNTGYGKEGTKGKFMIHLHFGIYRQVEGEERSLNPYALLRSL